MAPVLARPLQYTLESGIVVPVGIIVLVGIFVKINKCTCWNNRTGGNYLHTKYELKTYLQVSYLNFDIESIVTLHCIRLAYKLINQRSNEIFFGIKA